MAGNKGYLYTNGVIAAISKRLINKDTFYKMLDASSIDNAISIFNNTSFVGSKKINSVYDLNKVLDAEERNINIFLKNESPDDTFIDFVNAYYDFYNFENLYKKSLFKLNFDEESLIEGQFEISKIKEAINNNQLISDVFIKTAFDEINLIKDKQNSFAKIDLIFKNYYYKKLYSIVKKHKVLLKILQYKIDFQNLSLTSRAADFEEFKNSFIENGSLNLNYFKVFFDNEKTTMSSNDKLINNWLSILKSNKIEEKFSSLEKESKLVELKVLSLFTEDIETIIPFLKYYYRKQIEIKNLRMIFSLKLNNLNLYIKDKYLEEN